MIGRNEKKNKFKKKRLFSSLKLIFIIIIYLYIPVFLVLLLKIENNFEYCGILFF